MTRHEVVNVKWEPSRCQPKKDSRQIKTEPQPITFLGLLIVTDFDVLRRHPAHYLFAYSPATCRKFPDCCLLPRDRLVWLSPWTKNRNISMDSGKSGQIGPSEAKLSTATIDLVGPHDDVLQSGTTVPKVTLLEQKTNDVSPSTTTRETLEFLPRDGGDLRNTFAHVCGTPKTDQREKNPPQHRSLHGR